MEELIIEKLKVGKADEFEALYRKYRDKLYGYIYSKINNKRDVEDLVQEVFAKVYKNISYYDASQSCFYSFVLTNAKQVIAEYYRKRINREQNLEEVFTDLNIVDDDKIGLIYDSIEGEYNLHKLFDELPENQRLALDLVCMKNMSYKEAAIVMNKSETCVKSLIFRAKKTLKKQILEKYPDFEKEYGFKKALKLVLVSGVCLSVIGGFTYATWRIYQEKSLDKTFSIAEVNENVTDENSMISRDEANEKINNYLDILGLETNDNPEKLELKMDYISNESCWNYSGEDYILRIDSEEGKIVDYFYLGDSDKNTINFEEEILRKLNIIDNYELKSKDEIDGNYLITYAKKYGDLFNEYQSIKITVNNEKIINISVLDYDYEDREVLVSKEEAFEILENNGIVMEDLSLSIENVKFGIEGGQTTFLTDFNENFESKGLKIEEYDIRKVWKGLVGNVEYYVDSNNGEMFRLEK